MAHRHLFLLPLLATRIAALHIEQNDPSSSLEKRAGGPGGPGGDDDEEKTRLNDRLARLSLLCGGAVLVFFLIFNAALRFQAHIRRLTNLNNGSQRYFLPAHPYWAWMKKSVIYAPLFRSRHNREFRLSSAANMGTLPTRFQTVLLLGIIAMNTVLCVITIPFWDDEQTVLGFIRNRAGTMAVVNLVPLVVIAGRNNPLIKALDVSYDTWNLLHRWFGRIVVLETLVHTLAWMINKVRTRKYFIKSLSGPGIAANPFIRGLGRCTKVVSKQPIHTHWLDSEYLLHLSYRIYLVL
jgi:hypothetical protein